MHLMLLPAHAGMAPGLDALPTPCSGPSRVSHGSERAMPTSHGAARTGPHPAGDRGPLRHLAGRAVDVPLYTTTSVDAVTAAHPGVDWEQLRWDKDLWLSHVPSEATAGGQGDR
ncbi:hypothetical protein GCM10010377_70300 [Streptomyces viridiviolaceus]|nr:hypothetical protein GCM10010377_70300 [Streptomyces viridiviolaceus]